MNTVYKPRIASPYQPPKRHPFDFTSVNHPVRKEILKHVGKFDISIHFSEDTPTVGMLKIPGLVAFICRIEQGGKVIGIGRSNAVISETSKYFDRIIAGAWGYSLIDAISKMTRTIDTLRNDQKSQEGNAGVVIEESCKAKDSYGEAITDKQKSYLLELIHTNIQNEDERMLRESQIEEFTKEEASRAIQSFQK